MKTFPYAFLANVIAMAAFMSTAYADGVANHDPGPYKMTKFGGSGENIPSNGPVIHVFSKDGKSYTTISNDNENLNFTSSVGAICSAQSQKVESASVEVAGTTHDVSGTGGHAMNKHVESFQFPFTLPNIARDPAAACNFELDKRVSKSNKSRDYWMQKGFVVKYENAYEARFWTSCAGGLARGSVESKTIKTPVWIACAATDAGSEPRPDTSGEKPKRMPASRARPMPLKVTAKLEANQQGTIYASKCPVAVRYTGSIYASKPGTTVTYQISGTGWETPERKMTFNEAGSQEITGWTQRYRESESSPGRISNAPADASKKPDASGTVRLNVKYDGGSTQSATIPYTVFCNAEEPKTMQLKTKE